jgi:hypothetical protein
MSVPARSAAALQMGPKIQNGYLLEDGSNDID